MRLQRYQPWMNIPFKEELPLWVQQLYLALVDVVFMIVGALLFVTIGHCIVQLLMAFR